MLTLGKKFKKNFEENLQLERQMLKVPPLISWNPHLSITKCNCWSYDVIFGPKLKNPRYQVFVGNLEFLMKTFYWACNIVNLFFLGICHFKVFYYLVAFTNIFFDHIKHPSFGPILEDQEMLVQGFKRGCF